MALRNIFIEGDDILRKKAREVSNITERTLTLLEDMKETMDREQGVGIAAPQVGICRRVCIVAPTPENVIEMINPVILKSEGSQTSTEGCLSVPSMIGEVERPERIVVRYKDRTGAEHEIQLEGFDAVVASHEIDHLDGILYVDKAENIREYQEEEQQQ